MKNMRKNDKIDNKSGEELFKLLGELDEDMVEDAWLDHGEEVIIMEEKSPLRFVKIAAGIAAAIAVIGGGIYGFNRYKNSLGYSPAASASSDESTAEALSEPEVSEPESSAPEVINHEFRDEPTIFMGFGSDPIMSSDVTRVSIDKKPSAIMPEDVGASVYCEGFCYAKEPLGVAYNSYQHPEMFGFTGNPDKTDGNSFLGEMPQNTNEWKRLYEGEEICGLKLKHASTQFRINEPDVGLKIEILPEEMTFVSFEGTLEIEGILCVTAPNLNNDGGWYRFYPTEDKLPIIGSTLSKTAMDYHIAYAHETCAVHIVNEYQEIQIQKAEHYYEIDGIDIGDAVFARVTLNNIGFSYKGNWCANMDEVEILSKPIAHVDEWMQK